MELLASIVRYAPIPLFLVYLIFTTWLMRKFPLGGHRSISEHLSNSGKYFKVSAVIFSITAIGLCLNILFWVAPQHNGSAIYPIVATVFLLAGVGLSLFPSDTPRSQKRGHLVHLTSAYTLYMAVLVLSVATVFATYYTAPITSTVAQMTVVIYAWLMLLYLFYKPSHNHFILYETIAFSTFFILFISLSFNI